MVWFLVSDVSPLGHTPMVIVEARDSAHATRRWAWDEIDSVQRSGGRFAAFKQFFAQIFHPIIVTRIGPFQGLFNGASQDDWPECYAHDDNECDFFYCYDY